MTEPNSNTVPTAGGVPFIPENAPFSEAQRQWLNGLLAGMFSSAGQSHSVEKQRPRLTILFGSETGNAASLARKLKKEACAKGIDAEAVEMARFDTASLSQHKHVAVLTSTYGEGDPPANAASFHSFMHSDNAPKLDGMRYSVLALGDSNYTQFCKIGRDFDVRFEALGAERMYERVDCDVDFDAGYRAWADGVISAMLASADFGGGAGIGATEAGTPGKGGRPSPSGGTVAATEPDTATAVAVVEAAGTKANPFRAAITDSRILNGAESAKETRHIEFSLAGSGMQYEPGDALGVRPRNCPELVQTVLDLLNLDGEEAVLIAGEQMPLRLALEQEREIRCMTPPIFKALAERSRDVDLIATASDVERLRSYLHEHELVDVLLRCPAVIDGPQSLVDTLRPLQPRLYSIASSMKAVGEAVQLTVGVVRYTAKDRLRKGVCSSFLAERAREGTVPVFIHRNPRFRLPSDSRTPIIMVGPGTGIAPFRAFLQERAATPDAGPAWLFFGDQRSSCDFLYKDEIEQWMRQGTLSRLSTAFSRDQQAKIYVQQRMAEEAAELYRWLADGAHFYVCGDASRMAKDVDAALHRVIMKEGGLSDDAAGEYLDKLRADGRYQRDVY